MMLADKVNSAVDTYNRSLVRGRMVRNSILNSMLLEDFAAMRPWLSEEHFHGHAILQDQRRRIQRVGFVESGLVSVRRVSGDSSIEVALVDFRGAIGAPCLLGGKQAGYQSVAITQ